MTQGSTDALDNLQHYSGDLFYGYYREMKVIGLHTDLRRIWIAEGKRRGYELVDA